MHEIHRVSVRSRGFILSLWRGIPRIAWVTAFYLSFPMLMDVLVVSSLRLLWIMLLQASFHPWTFCWVWTFISVEYNTQEWNCLVRRNVYVQSNSYSWAVFKSACTSFHSSQQCVRGSVVPHLSQHLILSEDKTVSIELTSVHCPSFWSRGPSNPGSFDIKSLALCYLQKASFVVVTLSSFHS